MDLSPAASQDAISRAEKVIALRLALDTPGVYDVFDDLRIEGTVGKGPRKEIVVKATEAVAYLRRVIKRRLPNLDRAEVSADDEGVVNVVISDIHLTGTQLQSIADYLRSIADEIGANAKVTIL